MKGFWADEGGQAVLEYIFGLAMALSIVAVFYATLRRSIIYLWQLLSCEITAACPDCTPPADVKNRIFPGACR